MTEGSFGPREWHMQSDKGMKCVQNCEELSVAEGGGAAGWFKQQCGPRASPAPLQMERKQTPDLEV